MNHTTKCRHVKKEIARIGTHVLHEAWYVVDSWTSEKFQPTSENSYALLKTTLIEMAKGYGFTDQTRKTPVSTATLFQAGSISKPVAAPGALHLVEDGRLSLDDDVNRWLKQSAANSNLFKLSPKYSVPAMDPKNGNGEHWLCCHTREMWVQLARHGGVECNGIHTHRAGWFTLRIPDEGNKTGHCCCRPDW